jgi:hypothetical protein
MTQPVTGTNPADGSAWVFVANNRGLAAFALDTRGSMPTSSAELPIPAPVSS